MSAQDPREPFSSRTWSLVWGVLLTATVVSFYWLWNKPERMTWEEKGPQLRQVLQEHNAYLSALGLATGRGAQITLGIDLEVQDQILFIREYVAFMKALGNSSFWDGFESKPQLLLTTVPAPIAFGDRWILSFSLHPKLGDDHTLFFTD